jgi:hypothetical protein
MLSIILNKSPLPDSPNDLPATQRKEGRRPSQTKVSPNDLPATQMKEGRHLSQTKGHVSFIAIDLELEFKSTSSLLFCFMETAIFVVIVY